MKIAELEPGTSDVSLSATVESMDEPKVVNTKFGTQIELNVAIIKDDSGSIRMTLWGDQAKGIEIGKKVEITGAFVKEFKGEKQLSLTKAGKLEVSE